MSNRHITINIGPQDSESWVFISAAIAAVAFFWAISHEHTAKVDAAARVEVAKQAPVKP